MDHPAGRRLLGQMVSLERRYADPEERSRVYEQEKRLAEFGYRQEARRLALTVSRAAFSVSGNLRLDREVVADVSPGSQHIDGEIPEWSCVVHVSDPGPVAHGFTRLRPRWSLGWLIGLRHDTWWRADEVMQEFLARRA